MASAERRGAFKAKSPSGDSTNEDSIIANRYRIIEKVSKSKQSNIYSVFDVKSDEIKCLKMMSFVTQNKVEIKEIIREESILSSLDCPYILKYYESFLNNETICIITEYCEGSDLGQRIKSLRKKGEKLSEDRIIHWISQLLSACYYIHSKNILHRNIKPANILLKNGVIKLGDFGISRALQTNEYASSFIGTPYYMSPEVVKNEPYDAKSDIWSIGCVLYELATYQRPFVGDGVYDIFNSVINDETPSIVNLYSKELNKILKKMLTKIAKERPTAGELLCEPLISNYVKGIIEKSLDCARTSTKMAALINSLAPLSEIIDDDAFGEYDDKSTLRGTPKGTLRSTMN